MTRSLRLALFAGVLFASLPAHPQGCTQCQDNLRSTPPRTQAAYRHAIALMIVAGGGIFLAGLVILRRFR